MQEGGEGEFGRGLGVVGGYIKKGNKCLLRRKIYGRAFIWHAHNIYLSGILQYREILQT